MRRIGVVTVLVLALAGVAPAGVSDHLDPSPQVQLHGSSFVPGGIHMSPVQDPYQGAWHGIVSWQVGCGGAERWSWEVEFGDLAAGSYRISPDIRPHERSQSVFFYPTIATVSGRRLQSREAGPVVLRRGREVKAQLRIRESAVRKESVDLHLSGAGVNVRKQYRAGQLDRPLSLRFRPTKPGVVRYWVVMQPYGVRSLVYGLRVR